MSEVFYEENDVNYRHLLLLGTGSMGRSLLKIGHRQLSTFEAITTLDTTPLCRDIGLRGRSFASFTGDAEDLELLTWLIKRHPGPAVVVNLCSGVDSVRIRKHLCGLQAAYLDTSASLLPGRRDGSFAEIMSYTHTPADCIFPQLICWGMNPGLVEIIARRLMTDGEDGATGYEVTIYEYDLLDARTKAGRLGVGWSPVELIEEVMLTPTFEIRDGKAALEEEIGAKTRLVRWGGEEAPSRVVAHEDIWNLGMLPQVSSAKFFYALRESIMDVLSGAVAAAYELIGVPEDEVSLKGTDRIAVQVAGGGKTGNCLMWETDHGDVWKRFRVNAVQFQVCRSIQVALELLQHTHLGLMRGTYCASNLPLTPEDRHFMDHILAANDILWQPCEALGLCVTAH
jgi:hypothetical protein